MSMSSRIRHLAHVRPSSVSISRQPLLHNQHLKADQRVSAVENVSMDLGFLKTEAKHPPLSCIVSMFTSMPQMHGLPCNVRTSNDPFHVRISNAFILQLVCLIDNSMAAAPLTAAQQQQLAVLLQDLLEYQQYHQDRFSLYRRGQINAGRSLNAIKADFANGQPARLNRIWAKQVPRQNYTGRLTALTQNILTPLAAGARISYRVNAGQGGVNILSAPQKVLATNEFRRATTMMTAKRQFHFNKILGAGGNGMVVLWKWTPDGDPLASGHNVVMKLTTERDANGNPDYTTINHEKAMMDVSSTSLLRTPWSKKSRIVLISELYL